MCTLGNSKYPDERHFIWQTLFAETKTIFKVRNTIFFHKILTCVPSIYTMDHPKFIVSNQKEESIRA